MGVKKTKAEKAAAKAERKKLLAAKKAARLAKKAEKAGVAPPPPPTDADASAGGGAAPEKLKGLSNRPSLEHVHITGVLSSREESVDVSITNFSVGLFGQELISDATLQINAGRRYGLIGQNGSGKTTLMRAIAAREIPIPDHIDIWHLETEAKPEEVTAMDAVMNVVRAEEKRLEALMEKLLEEDPEDPRVAHVCDSLDKLDLETLEPRAGELLFGLGFTQEMMYRDTCDMSGGWRMRVALAQALLVCPSMLLLDEPTNHLDLGACVWLEDYLSKYPKTLIVVSHSQDFLNSVCTNIMHLYDSRLEYYGGNYDTFVRTREEKRTNQLKRHKKEQEDIKHIKRFIASCGTFSNLVKQAQSKQKIIDKMVERGLTPKPTPDPKYHFKYPLCGGLPPPVMSFKEVSFSYSGRPEDYLYENLDFGVDLDSRVAIVGPNGAGKSTLLKLMIGELVATKGDVGRHGALRIAYYNQHSEAQLELDLNPIQFLQKTFPDGIYLPGNSERVKPEIPHWRQILGSFGITGTRQTDAMGTFSDGLKSRVVFALMGLRNPHILLLDEPTNHLDMECINSLAEAINEFEGGMVLVSHDFRLLSQVAREIWVVDEKKVTVWRKEGGIRSYKAHLRKQGERALEKHKKQFGGKKKKKQ